MGWIPGGGKIPWCGKWQLTPVFLPGESQGTGAGWAITHGVTQIQTQLKQSILGSKIPQAMLHYKKKTVILMPLKIPLCLNQKPQICLPLVRKER